MLFWCLQIEGEMIPVDPIKEQVYKVVPWYGQGYNVNLKNRVYCYLKLSLLSI